MLTIVLELCYERATEGYGTLDQRILVPPLVSTGSMPVYAVQGVYRNCKMFNTQFVKSFAFSNLAGYK